MDLLLVILYMLMIQSINQCLVHIGLQLVRCAHKAGNLKTLFTSIYTLKYAIYKVLVFCATMTTRAIHSIRTSEYSLFA